jgi:hypothetical protein
MHTQIQKCLTPLLILSMGLSFAFTPSTAFGQDKDKKIYIRVIAVKAAGKVDKTATFDKGTAHLKGAFKNLRFASYSVLKSLKKECVIGKKQLFEIGLNLELSLTPDMKKGRYVTAVSLSSIGKDAAGQKTLKSLLAMKAKSKDGKSVVLGSQQVKKENFHLLIVLTLQSKPFP